MKRDMHLIKEVLKYVERKHTADGQYLPLPEFPGYDEYQIQYHVELCADAGYLTATGSDNIYIRRLTWAGQEELERLRRECV